MQFDVRSAHTSGYARNRDAKRESERERERVEKKRDSNVQANTEEQVYGRWELYEKQRLRRVWKNEISLCPPRSARNSF